MKITIQLPQAERLNLADLQSLVECIHKWFRARGRKRAGEPDYGGVSDYSPAQIKVEHYVDDMKEMIEAARPEPKTLRNCEVCKGPGPCLYDGGQHSKNFGRYVCVKCHGDPGNPFFKSKDDKS